MLTDAGERDKKSATPRIRSTCRKGTDTGAALVVERARRAQLNGPAAGPQLAAAGGQDVLDPVCIRAVCQGEEVAAAGRKHIDRCLITPPGRPAPVNEHAKAGHPGRDQPGEAVQAGLVPTPYRLGYWHVSTLLPQASRSFPDQHFIHRRAQYPAKRHRAQQLSLPARRSPRSGCMTLVPVMPRRTGQNGGSARVLPDLVHHSASPSIDVVGAA